MTMQDPIADMLTQIRNAQKAGKVKITLRASKLKLAILKVLQEEGYIDGFSVTSADNKKDIHITLRYYNQQPVISKIKRVSRPGLRVYKSYNDMPAVLEGLGIAIVSTSKGVMTAVKAAAHLPSPLGGEVLCTVE